MSNRGLGYPSSYATFSFCLGACALAGRKTVEKKYLANNGRYVGL